MSGLFSGSRRSGKKHGDCWDSHQSSTAHCQGAREDRRGCNFGGLVDKTVVGGGREGIGVRPVNSLDLDGLAPDVHIGRLAGARPNAVVLWEHLELVAAAHCDERQRRALFTSEL